MLVGAPSWMPWRSRGRTICSPCWGALASTKSATGRTGDMVSKADWAPGLDQWGTSPARPCCSDVPGCRRCNARVCAGHRAQPRPPWGQSPSSPTFITRVTARKTARLPLSSWGWPRPAWWLTDSPSNTCVSSPCRRSCCNSRHNLSSGFFFLRPW